MRIEIVWAERDEQRCIVLALPLGATVRDALDAAALRPEFAHVDIERAPVGVFGRVVRDRDQRLEEGDRIEFYRSLEADPITARRARVSRRAD